MRRILALAIIGMLGLLAACGSGSQGNAAPVAKQPTDPKAVPTATLPAILPSPIPAVTPSEGDITGQLDVAPTSYTIQSGDNMAAIAQKLGVPVALLASYNPDVDPTNLKIGQVLRIPPPPSPTAPPTPAGGLTISRTTVPSGSGSPTSSRTATPVAGGQAGSSAGQSYTVQAGDTACKIAGSFGVSLQQLAAANATTPTAIASLKVGQVLQVPASTGAAPGC